MCSWRRLGLFRHSSWHGIIPVQWCLAFSVVVSWTQKSVSFFFCNDKFVIMKMMSQDEAKEGMIVIKKPSTTEYDIAVI